MNPDYLFFFVALSIVAIIAWIGWRNSLHYSKEAAEIGEMLMNVKCDIEGDDAAYAKILKLTVAEYKTERQKGRVLYRAGMRICGISEGLKSPFRFWR
jgi:hypothetical protein